MADKNKSTQNWVDDDDYDSDEAEGTFGLDASKSTQQQSEK